MVGGRWSVVSLFHLSTSSPFTLHSSLCETGPILLMTGLYSIYY